MGDRSLATKPSMAIIKGIFFDAAGVLYTRTEPTAHYMARLLRDRGLGGDLSPAGRSLLKTLRSQANRGQIGPDAYWDRSLELHGVQQAAERRALVEMINLFSSQVLPLPGVRETLAGLKQRALMLGVITDTMYPIETKMHWLDQIGVAEFVDTVTCSTAVGVQKPDPRIYQLALEKAGLTAAEAGFVGHDTEELAGAQRVGMATVAVYHDPDARADHYTKTLPDLLELAILQPPHTMEREYR